MSLENTIPRHVPVLPEEVVRGLEPLEGCLAVDLTVGGGGHTELLARRVGPAGKVIGLDCDAEQLGRARCRLADLPVELVHARFDQAAEVLREQGLQADRVLADLGFCSEQLDDPERGLAFRHEGLADMRLDRSRGEPAHRLLDRLDERELARIPLWGWAARRYGVIIVDRRGSAKMLRTANMRSVPIPFARVAGNTFFRAT